MGLDTNRTMVFQMFTFLFCLVGLAMGATFLFRRRFTVRRELPRFATAGEAFTYRVYVRNRSSRPLTGLLLFDDPERQCPSYEEFVNLAEPGEERRNPFDRYMGVYRFRWLVRSRQGARASAVPLPSLAPGEEKAVRITFTPQSRGILRFEAVTAACPDPFGLFFGLVTAAAKGAVTVLPRRYPVNLPRLAGARKYQSGGVALAGSVGESEEFVSMRDYRPGDPLRRIHWRSWAKRGEPVVKEFQEEFFVRYALVLDTFQARDRDFRFLEEAVSIAASFAANLVTGESLLDLMFAEDRVYRFTAGRSVGRVEGMLELLASVGPCVDKPFSLLSDRVTRSAPGMSGCILVLTAWDDERKKLTGDLKSMGVPLRVIVVGGEDSVADPGPMADEPAHFIPVDPQRPGEGLGRLA